MRPSRLLKLLIRWRWRTEVLPGGYEPTPVWSYALWAAVFGAEEKTLWFLRWRVVAPVRGRLRLPNYALTPNGWMTREQYRRYMGLP